MIVEPLGGLGVRLVSGRHSLELEPPSGKGLFTGSPPFYRSPSPPGSFGPFSWEPVEVPGLRGTVTGYLIRVEGLELFYAGGLSKPIKMSADVIIAPAGGLWYADAKSFCETVKLSSPKVAVPIAIWWPGSMRALDGIEEVKVECRGFRRVRAKKRWKVDVNTAKATIALIESG
jgi:hypothetical protein